MWVTWCGSLDAPCVRHTYFARVVYTLQVCNDNVCNNAHVNERTQQTVALAALDSFHATAFNGLLRSAAQSARLRLTLQYHAVLTMQHHAASPIHRTVQQFMRACPRTHAQGLNRLDLQLVCYSPLGIHRPKTQAS